MRRRQPAIDPIAGSADAVVLACGDQFADALAGIPLAKAKNGPLLMNGPLLLTDPRQLPPATANILIISGNTLSNVQMFGGPVAIQPSVVTEIRQALQPRTVGYTFLHLGF